ncbi:MAG: cysteine dioxygenase [Actinomycetes bacterium]
MTDPTQLMTATGTPAQAASAEASVIVDEVAQIVTLPSTDGVPAQAAERLDQVRRGLSLDSLPGRDLDRHELRELVASIAADPSQWRQHVAFSDDKRHYVQLHRDGHVDVWVLCWTPQNDTGWHDHDISSGAVAVAEGCLTEHNLAVGAPSLQTDVPAGHVFCFGPDHIHRLTGRDAGSVSVHAYSPPLWRMGQYAVSRTGVLRRTSVSYADELRPLDDML